MNHRRRLLIALVSLALFPVQVWACACCADDGEYRISFRKPGASEFGLLQEVRFGPRAQLIETQADVSDAINSPGHRAESYSLTASLDGGLWKLAFKDGNQSGTLSLVLPPKMLSYAVDTHDGQKGGGGGPVLYKEWRFEGRLSGTGFFRSGSGPRTTYFLVLQGRGNRCDSSEDFSHWRLELKGPKAKYAFYGEMVRGNATGYQR